jgi:tRNA dimethylallyltransferase
MVNTPTRPPLIAILGPTAVGKTELSIRLAERLNGEIVSADSRLLYQGMDIGTAKPTPAEQARVPHHLIDVVTPEETWSLAQFQVAAHAVIGQIHRREKLPFLVGGTGQYMHAIIQGWQIPEVEPNPQLREFLDKWATEVTPIGLHERLAVLDIEAAKTIDPRNVRRTIRALEVILSTGERFSTQRKQAPSPYEILQMGIMRPREELYARIDQRIQTMFDEGFVEEVKQLLEQGYSPDLPTMSAIGYQEISMYLLGKTSMDEAIIQMKRRTRVFVRRQANWFRLSNPNIHWFQYSERTMEAMEQIIHAWLNKNNVSTTED